MMAAVVVISVPLILLFLVFRKKIMEGVSRGGTKDEYNAQKDRHNPSFSPACPIDAYRLPRKGGQKSFSIPEQLDTSRQYEITFWAKNDTNKTQTDIYKKAITDFQTLYPNITVNLRLYTIMENL